MAQQYAFAGYDPERMTRATLRDVSISFKSAIMLSQLLRGMMSDKAEACLEAVKAKRRPVPFTRFTDGVGHRRGPLGAGRYPVKAATSFLELLKQAQANAENKGLGTPLKIVHILANEASRPMRYGRQRGRQMKRTHIELVLAETEESKKRERKQPVKKAVKPTAPAEKAESKEEKTGEKEKTPQAASKKEASKEKSEEKRESPEEQSASKPATEKASSAKADTREQAKQEKIPAAPKKGSKEQAESSAPAKQAPKEEKKDGN